jgi:hypothetical protein
VSFKQKLRKALLCMALGIALQMGAPMSPQEIEELLCQASMPEVAQTFRREKRQDDE